MSLSKRKQRSNGSKHSDILVGVALLLLAAVFAYLGFSQPKISNDYTVSESETEIYEPAFDVTADSAEETSAASTASSSYSTTQSAASSQSSSSETLEVSFPINLNTCTKEQLMAIDGIGDARAEAILAYRKHLGGYTSTEQLMNISGIGETLYSKIAPYVTV